MPLTLSRSTVLRLALLIAVPVGMCQTQYPPQYPPGQYPPQYPPGQYPPDTVRLPGGVPVGVPVPEIKLPKKKAKDDKSDTNDTKMQLVGVDGTLRELGEKDLFLEIANKKLLQFRLLAKTEFKDKEGAPVRDSLLKPGDQLSVHANKIDPETALRVVLTRKGTPAEQRTAGLPFDRASAHTPEDSDMHPVGSIEVANTPTPGAGSSADSGDPGRPRLTRAEDESTPPRLAGSGAADDVIAAARTASESFEQEIPNFVVEQATTRYQSVSIPAQWTARDVVTAEVVCVNGKEEYRNIRVNGRPSQEPIEKTGAWSTGEFVTTLLDILSQYTAADFTRRGEDTVSGRPALVYDLKVQKSNSHWEIVAPDGRSVAPSYTGSIWIDKESHRVLRIEKRTGVLPSDFPFDKAESTLEYSFVRIESNTYLLPARSENLACHRGTTHCVLNQIDFRNYRKFGADSNVTFGKYRATDW